MLAPGMCLALNSLRWTSNKTTLAGSSLFFHCSWANSIWLFFSKVRICCEQSFSFRVYSFKIIYICIYKYCNDNKRRANESRSCGGCNSCGQSIQWRTQSVCKTFGISLPQFNVLRNDKKGEPANLSTINERRYTKWVTPPAWLTNSLKKLWYNGEFVRKTDVRLKFLSPMQDCFKEIDHQLDKKKAINKTTQRKKKKKLIALLSSLI